jgi:hypothetical protein
MSTGAWIFTGLICAAVIAPASVYAAAITKVALTGASGTNVASVTTQHQLLTAPVTPSQVVRVSGGSLSGCKTVYTPPAHKAIVVMSVVYTFGSGTNGVEHFGGLGPAGCSSIYDQFDGVQAFDTIQHTFPTGLPLPSVAISNSGAGEINVFVIGYLIDSSGLPARTATHVGSTVKAVSPGR